MAKKSDMAQYRSQDHARKIKRTDLIVALANFITKDQAKKSILLDPRMAVSPGHTLAKEWAELANLVGVIGYPKFEEVRAEIERILQ